MTVLGLVEINLQHSITAVDRLLRGSSGVFWMMFVHNATAVADDPDGFFRVSHSHSERCKEQSNRPVVGALSCEEITPNVALETLVSGTPN